jgi:septal ring factor EnvC (AmiA/AmiB activator)
MDPRDRRQLPAGGVRPAGRHQRASATKDDQRSSEEAQAKQKLDDVRAEIRRIAEAQKQIAAQKNDTTEALRAQELKISATAKEVRALDQKLEGQQARLAQLVKQRDALEATLKTQREALAGAAAFSLRDGRNEELRLLLARTRSDRSGRPDCLLPLFRTRPRCRNRAPAEGPRGARAGPGGYRAGDGPDRRSRATRA